MVVVITIVLLPLILMMTTMTMVLMITILPLIILVMMEVMLIIGSLSNDDGDFKENGNNAIGLDWQDNNFACASHFFVHFLAVVARLQRESA